MVGFTDKALILMPGPEAIENETVSYKMRLKTAYNKLCQYCLKNNMTPCVLWSDELAHKYADNSVTILRTLTRGDEMFMAQNNDTFTQLQQTSNAKSMYSELIKEASAKLPIEKGLPIEKRFDIVCKRERTVTKEIIKDFRLVFNIQIGHKAQYKASTSTEDMRIVINFDARTFIGVAEMSGNEVSIIDITGLNCSNHPLYEWEV